MMFTHEEWRLLVQEVGAFVGDKLHAIAVQIGRQNEILLWIKSKIEEEGKVEQKPPAE
jgi:hypothetical protein